MSTQMHQGSNSERQPSFLLNPDTKQIVTLMPLGASESTALVQTDVFIL